MASCEPSASPHQVLPVMRGFASGDIAQTGQWTGFEKGNSCHLGGKRHQEGFFTFVILAQFTLYDQYTKKATGDVE
ncbi:hypothetical protein ACVXHA_24900 [Escherichia coli]